MSQINLFSRNWPPLTPTTLLKRICQKRKPQGLHYLEFQLSTTVRLWNRWSNNDWFKWIIVNNGLKIFVYIFFFFLLNLLQIFVFPSKFAANFKFCSVVIWAQMRTDWKFRGRVHEVFAKCLSGGSMSLWKNFGEDKPCLSFILLSFLAFFCKQK